MRERRRPSDQSSRLFSLYFVASMLAAVLYSQAGAAAPEVYSDDGVAIGGYDTVAYFTDDAAVKGLPEFSQDWHGASWQFASAEHRDLFAADPEKYAPRFGGYCAYAAAKGHLAPTDPRAWHVEDGKLYLNYNAPTQKVWLRDKASYIESGEQNWPDILSDAR